MWTRKFSKNKLFKLSESKKIHKSFFFQEELLREDNSQLRVQIDLAEKSRQIAKKDADSLAAMHQALLTDHDRLQNLHDLLTQDYERARLENVEMKTKLKTQRRKHKERDTTYMHSLN
ncbi:unnamed protein product [Strongylus vulgaris]|uniref:Uncharacterized protein n=1 Tax=Strongylus vulgaris TaxID=40348 RepID=A0A3P7JV66_STRVU|nr:unnamed protein product [Strongylus vulgaris]